MNTICSSAREVAAVVEEEEEEAVVEKAEAVVEKAVEAVAPKVALEALAVRMFPPRMDTLNVLDALDPLGTPGLLSTPTSSCRLSYSSDLTIITVEADLPVPTSVAQLVEEADPNHNTEAASTTAAARQLLTAPVPRAL